VEFSGRNNTINLLFMPNTIIFWKLIKTSNCGLRWIRKRERKIKNIRQQLNLENVGTGIMSIGTMGTKNLIVIPIYNFSCQ